MTHHTIRDGIPADVEQLYRLEVACFESGYADKMMSRDDFAETIAEKTDTLIVIEVGGQIAAYGLLLIDRETQRGAFDSLATRPDFQGQGLGGIIFKAIEDRATAEGLAWLDLEIKENNYALLQRYHKFGYLCFACVPHYYADGLSALRMTRVLTPPLQAPL
jgi:ribosomal protein S18 acetylase RimI-like enzyme